MMVELRVGVTLNGWSPMIWAPVKGGSKGNEAKGRGAWCQITSSLMKPEPQRTDFQFISVMSRLLKAKNM